MFSSVLRTDQSLYFFQKALQAENPQRERRRVIFGKLWRLNIGEVTAAHKKIPLSFIDKGIHPIFHARNTQAYRPMYREHVFSPHGKVISR